MKIKKLLKGIKYRPIEPCSLDKEISGIATDHRKVKKGDVFIAIKGENFDGNDYVDEAIKNGASVVLTEALHYSQKCIRVENARQAYAIASKHFYDDACDKLKIVAVTGTNGKTTTCNTIADILKANGKKVGVIGTMGASFEGEVIDTGMTTPDPHLLHSIFAKFLKKGVEYVVMEASAHALALHKLDGIKFEVGVLTNITEDHLDFFGDMESYAKAKLKLFEEGRVKNAIICDDKIYDKSLLENLKISYKTYNIDEKVGENNAIFAKNIEKSFFGSKFDCFVDGENISIKTPLVGEYNIENVLASVGVCRALGLEGKQIEKGARQTLPVEGRYNVININDINIIIDFAHTPDGLEKVLMTTKELSNKKLVVIFGCGGNRDRLKRPIMGEIASRLADEVILTSDNPRFEKPNEIIKEIKKGIKNKKVTAIADRKKAIEFALSKYQNGETILIAGKGGEKYQDIGGVKIPYNDFDEVNKFFRKQFARKKNQVENVSKEKEFEDDGRFI